MHLEFSLKILQIYTNLIYDLVRPFLFSSIHFKLRSPGAELRYVLSNVIENLLSAELVPQYMRPTASGNIDRFSEKTRKINHVSCSRIPKYQSRVWIVNTPTYGSKYSKSVRPRGVTNCDQRLMT